MSGDPSYAIGIDIGGTRLKSVAVTAPGRLLASSIDPTEDLAEGWNKSIPARIALIEAEQGPARAIGISSPGLARRDHRSIAWMQGRMAGLQGYDWTRELARGRFVPVINDAHAALIGEAWLGAARGQREVVLLTLGTGVGGAILCDGRVLEGHLGRAGHLGHISLDPDGAPDLVGAPGSLEDAVGQHTLKQRSGGRFETTLQLLDALSAGDPQARAVWDRSIKALAAGVASIINITDPAVVVIGGGIAQSGEALFGPLVEQVRRFEWRPTGAAVEIVPAQLGELAGAYGAARFALDDSDPAQPFEPE